MKIAIIGSGISGLTAGYLLNRNHDISIYEANDYIGGHTHTFLPKPTVTENKKGEKVLVNQVGAYGVNLGRIDFFFDSQKNKTSQEKIILV